MPCPDWKTCYWWALAVCRMCEKDEDFKKEQPIDDWEMMEWQNQRQEQKQQ